MKINYVLESLKFLIISFVEKAFTVAGRERFLSPYCGKRENMFMT